MPLARKVGKDAAGIYLSIDGIGIVFRQSESHAAFQNLHLNVAGQIVDVNFTRIVVDDDTGVFWSVDAVFEIESFGSAKRRRWRENRISWKIRPDDEFIAAPCGGD